MSAETFLNGRVTLMSGDSRDVLKTLADNSIDSIVCDPPYALVSIVKRFGAGGAPVKVPEGGSGAYARASSGFMGKTWDTGETAFAVDFWAECLRVLKPGGHVVAFSGTRTYHRMACAIEDAGFEVRDMLSWLYGSGFPKSHDVSKGIDASLGAVRQITREAKVLDEQRPDHIDMDPRSSTDRERRDIPATDAARQWEGWGTAVKPACEPICFGRKPLIGTVAANVLQHGTGAINIDGCRVGTTENLNGGAYSGGSKNLADATSYATGVNAGEYVQPTGRWPANIIHDGSEEVTSRFPFSASGTGAVKRATGSDTGGNSSSAYGKESRPAGTPMICHGDDGSASRFFYTAKADADDRLGSKHPTVKPVDLMQWLCRLVTPKGGTVLDPFAGTGTTGEAAFREGFNAVLIEREPEYQADIRRRMALCMSGPDERKRVSIKAKVGDVPFEPGSLFAGIEAAE